MASFEHGFFGNPPIRCPYIPSGTPDIPWAAPDPPPGEFFPSTGDDMGGQDTGVPGLDEPGMGRGELDIMPAPTGLDIGSDVAGE